MRLYVSQQPTETGILPHSVVQACKITAPLGRTNPSALSGPASWNTDRCTSSCRPVRRTNHPQSACATSTSAWVRDIAKTTGLSLERLSKSKRITHAWTCIMAFCLSQELNTLVSKTCCSFPCVGRFLGMGMAIFDPNTQDHDKTCVRLRPSGLGAMLRKIMRSLLCYSIRTSPILPAGLSLTAEHIWHWKSSRCRVTSNCWFLIAQSAMQRHLPIVDRRYGMGTVYKDRVSHFCHSALKIRACSVFRPVVHFLDIRRLMTVCFDRICGWHAQSNLCISHQVLALSKAWVFLDSISSWRPLRS